MGFYSSTVKLVQVSVLSAVLFSPAQAETILIMFESEGCPYCDLWKEQIGPAYPKTAEGQRAPLMMVDISDPLPEGITIGTHPVFTPTFVLVDNGQEVTRLVGYPGENFFWGLLERMLSKLPEQNTEGSS